VSQEPTISGLSAEAHAAPAASDGRDRSVLPIAGPKLAPITTLDARDQRLRRASR
jgi:hypothetical protein